MTRCSHDFGGANRECSVASRPSPVGQPPPGALTRSEPSRALLLPMPCWCELAQTATNPPRFPENEWKVRGRLPATARTPAFGRAVAVTVALSSLAYDVGGARP
jgi:hypothetical protein